MAEEITIPEPVNRPKGETKQKKSHPESQQPVKFGKTINKPQGSSRFEPAAIPVELPSHGYAYKGRVDDPEVANGIIRIRPMTLNDEKVLTTDRLVKQGKALDILLENTIKSSVDTYDLLSTDRMYLLFYLRGMSYGLKYEFDVKCYHCGYNFIQMIEVDKLPIKEWLEESDAKEPIVIELPASGATVEAHFMRGHEEREMTEIEMRSKSYDELDETTSNSILYLVDKVILPDGEVLGPADKEDFLTNLITSDIEAIREEVADRSCGIKQLDNIRCAKCEGDLEFNVPLGRNFFRRSRQ